MKIILILGALVVCAILICWLIHKILEAAINLHELHKRKGDYSHPSFDEGGIVFNKETNQLEGSGGKHMLPFD